MKNLIRSVVLVFVLVGMSMTSAQSQNYDKAIGVRLGYGIGVSGKMFISESSAIEVGARFFTDYTGIFGLYQIHNDIDAVEGLQYYYGGGVNVGIYGLGYGGSNTAFGIMGALGLDYKFDDLPINVSVDWLPTFALSGYGFGAYNGGIAVRYVL